MTDSLSPELNVSPEEDPFEDAAPEQQDPNAVLILRIEDEKGIHTEVVPLGDVKPTEVQTIIELGQRSWRQKIGLT